MPKFTKQIVAFIDILGFSSLLNSFEQEAMENDSQGDSNFHESETLNELIAVFEYSVSLIRQSDCNYYLFSDNICITIDYIENETEYPDTFVDILQLINLLTFEFVKKGYFLRGGVDSGWFLDSRDIAVGVPLVTAYALESRVAKHPRVVISDNFKTILDEYVSRNSLTEYSEYIAGIILKSEDGIQYIDPFAHIVSFDDKASKIDFLATYRKQINAGLVGNRDDEGIFAKYEWLAGQFNLFIDCYVTGYSSIDSDLLEFSDEELEIIYKLKL